MGINWFIALAFEGIFEGTVSNEHRDNINGLERVSNSAFSV